MSSYDRGKITKVTTSGCTGSMTTAGARKGDLVSHKSQIHLGMQPQIPELERRGGAPPKVCKATSTSVCYRLPQGSKGIVGEAHPSPGKIGSSFPGLSLLF